jgi:prephenate dehydratase
MSKNTIAFQGVLAAHSDLACRKAYPYMDTLACPTFDAVFEAVETGAAALGMIPIENSYAGRVAEVHNILAHTKLHIVAEHFQRVEHHLLAPKNAKLESLKEVRSHPMALMQCAKNIKKLKLELKTAENTAIAAKLVAEWNDAGKGAIASELAAEIYGLQILKRNMEDAPTNMTVFIVIGKEPVEPKENENVITTLLVTIRNMPAALYKSLGGFATNNVNLVKLESYIPGGKSDNADFFISFQGHPKQRNVQYALEELGFFTRKVKLLGVYAADPERFKK